MDKLLTKKELAERWQVSEPCIDKWRREGLITPCEGIPSIRFTLQHISELEGLKIERVSPIERKRLEKEIEEWKMRALNAENALAKVNMIITETLYKNIKEK